MGLTIFWFVLVTLLWTGFVVPEGRDFGVGMLHRVVGLCVAHGAAVLARKVDGPVRGRAHAVARTAAPIAGVAVLGFVLWTPILVGGVVPGLGRASAVLAAALAALAVPRSEEGWAL